MANTGNRDLMLGILKNDRDRDLLREALAAIVANTDLNLVTALSRFVDDHFVAWDDDSGDGYDAFLSFPSLLTAPIISLPGARSPISNSMRSRRI